MTRSVTMPPSFIQEDWRLGRYVVRFKVAQGGMGAVYLAQLETQGGFRKWVALKTIDPKLAVDRSFVKMFLDEAKLTARIEHPNVCSVFDFGEENGTYFLAMEYLHGEALNTIMRVTKQSSGLSMGVAARIIADAARGLHAAHELRLDDGRPANVVHRDISPQNIFVLYDGVAKVVDFGVALSSGGTDRSGELAGKRPYMSPEQLRGEGVDRRSDLWSLGVVLWEVTSGRRLFRRDSDQGTTDAILHENLDPPGLHVPGYPRELEAIVMKLLARDPAMRFQTGAEVARALEQFMSVGSEVTTIDDVALMMQQNFSDRIASRELAIRARGQDRFGPMPDEDLTHAPGADQTGRQVAPPRLGSNKSFGSHVWSALGTLLTLTLIVGMVGGAGYLIYSLPKGSVITPEPVNTAVIPLVAPDGSTGYEAPFATALDAGLQVFARPLETRAIPHNAGYFTVQGGRAGGAVSEGGTLLGTLPLRHFPLAPGRHVLRIVTGPGSVTRSVTVHIRAGSEHVEHFAPAH
ncbi:MAG: serine/threonine-protein kinase [Deltaproteobacteria bacterium]|nr:serine/threonine-protein kinase [Deltaproteobacteria bacterium]